MGMSQSQQLSAALSFRQRRSIAFNECAYCGAMIPKSPRLLCWKHTEMLRGATPVVELEGDTQPLPGITVSADPAACRSSR
jgi:hypothetical protein